MTTHTLKIWPEYFEDVATGYKNFEIRLNDREYKIGDQLHLREHDADEDKYSNRMIIATIEKIWELPFMKPDNMVAMRIRVYGVHYS